MHIKVLYALAALLLAGGTGAVSAGRDTSLPRGSLPSAVCARIDSVITAAITDHICPGAVAAVVKNDTILFLKAYGLRQTIPYPLPMTDTTLFDLASLSKCVGTAPVIMHLMERGRLTLDDKVTEYIPEFAPWTDGRDTVAITIRHLLTHSSGLASYIPRKRLDSMYAVYGGPAPDSLMHYIATKAKRNFKPGTKCLYSCLNFVTLQNIAERITGERLCDCASHDVFDILGMTHTCYIPVGTRIPEGADIAATEVIGGKPLVGKVHDPMARLLNGGNSGNAGVFSNAEDLALYCSAIMNGGEIHGRRILDSATVARMCRIPSKTTPAVKRALGWDCDTKAAVKMLDDATLSHRHVCHTGYTGTSIAIDLDRKIAVILLTNRVHPEDKGSLTSTRRALSEVVSSSLK